MGGGARTHSVSYVEDFKSADFRQFVHSHMKNYTKEEIQKAIEHSKSMKHAATFLDCNYKTFFTYAKKYNLFTPNPSGKGTTKNRPPTILLENILLGKEPQYNTFQLKLRLIKNNYFKWECSRCHNTTWLNEPIPLELDHIDGQHNNHRLENLRLLCPNCHAKTDTYRSKNKVKQYSSYNE